MNNKADKIIDNIILFILLLYNILKLAIGQQCYKIHILDH